jgi:hypothetical protein
MASLLSLSLSMVLALVLVNTPTLVTAQYTLGAVVASQSGIPSIAPIVYL